MVKEDFSLKKDVLQIQKKIADLELTATELKEALTKFDTSVLDELKQRVEDVEDLTMVENAAVIELKNMLQETKPEQPQEAVSPPLEERLNALEQKVSGIAIPNVEEIKSSITSSLPATPTVDTSSFEQKISEIKSGFDSLKTDLNNKIAGFEERISQMKNTLAYLPNLSTLKSDLKNEVLSSLPDYGLVQSDMQSMIETFKSELDAEKGKVDAALEIIKRQIERPLPERVVEELGKIRTDWLVNNAKVEAVEKFVENFSNELNNLKPILAKLETFDRLLNLHEEVSDKLKSFEEFQDNIQDAVEKNEDVEKRIQREVNKLRETGKEISKIEDTLSKLTKEVDKIKKAEEKTFYDLNSKFKGVVDPLEDRIDSITLVLKDTQDATMGLDKKLDSVEKNIATVQDDMSVFQGNLMALEQGRSDMTASIANLQETVFKKQPKNEVVELAKRIDSLDAELQSIKSLKPEDTTNELVKKINELEGRIETVRASTPFDEHMSEIVSRLVFLESRLAGLEGMIQDTRYAPIVVE